MRSAKLELQRRAGLAKRCRSAHLLVFNNEAFLLNLCGSGCVERSFDNYSFQRRLFPEALKIFHTQTKEPTKGLKLISHGHLPTEVLFIISSSLCLENHWVKTKALFRSSTTYSVL